MTLDEALVERAKVAAAQVAEAERLAQVARGDYHTMIRRLHLGGGSLREIALALGLSHQRVQQIVDAAGGSWWHRIWRTRTPARDTVCTFCSRPPSEVAKLLAGPNVFVCDQCIGRAERALTGTVAGFEPAKRGRARCSFCSKQRTAERAVVVNAAASICSDCLRACAQILADRAV